MSCSIQVKVMAPSRLLSLKRSRKVPGHLPLSRAFSLSLLMKPMMELRTEAKDGSAGRAWERGGGGGAELLTRRSTGTAGASWSNPGSLRSTARRRTLSRWHLAAEQTTACQHQPAGRPGLLSLTLQNLVQGMSPSGFLCALAPAQKHFQFASLRPTENPSASFLTQQFVRQHVELLLVQASLGDGGELPAENLGQLRPLGGRRRQEELEVLGASRDPLAAARRTPEEVERARSSLWARWWACCTRGWRPSRWAAGTRWRWPPRAATWPAAETPRTSTLAGVCERTRTGRPHLQLDAQAGLVELQLRLEAEWMQLLRDDQRTLKDRTAWTEVTIRSYFGNTQLTFIWVVFHTLSVFFSWV